MQKKMHVAIWALIHSVVVIISMILAACVAYNIVGGESRIIIFYVIAGEMMCFPKCDFF
jgi:predicted small secreted protein